MNDETDEQRNKKAGGVSSGPGLLHVIVLL